MKHDLALRTARPLAPWLAATLLTAALSGVLAAPAAASAAAAPAAGSVRPSAAAPPTATPTAGSVRPPAAALAAAPAAPPTGTPATPTTAVAGKMRLSLQYVGGKPLFALVGREIVVRGSVTPYVSGQAVKVSIYRNGAKVQVKTVGVQALGNGSGQFRVAYDSDAAGLVQARAAHYATEQQSAFSAISPDVRYVSSNVSAGARGASVALLQSELAALHYAVSLTGTFDEGTGRALIAYRKMTGLARIPYAGRQVFLDLQRGAGAFHVRYPRDGRHVEADLTRQVLAEIEPHGRVRAIYTMSSGKPSTPTVIGRFRVYLKTPGVNSEGMVDSNYFIRGYAIHGYAEVPTYAASHGCLRLPIPDAAPVYAWVHTGTPVDVYDEGGGGSRDVRSDAGP